MSRGRIVFVDPVATDPYDARTLERQALGGTESTVVRLAHALSAQRPVTVQQAARRDVADVDGVRYAPYEHKGDGPLADDVDAIVVVRATKVLDRIRRRHPVAKLVLWMHCHPGKRLRDLGPRAAEAQTEIVTVSHSACAQLSRFLWHYDPASAAHVPLWTIHNPVAPDLPFGGAWDPDKLVYLSSPHKGLDEVYEVFVEARRRWPSLRLHVANPGYLTRGYARPEGVVTLGTLRHTEAMEHLAGALCLFYPQTTFSETFGLVFAEAHAVGTPVLAHPLGAAMEVVGDGDQVFDCTDRERVLSTLGRWRDGARPRVSQDPRVSLFRVAWRWELMLRRMARPERPGRTLRLRSTG